MNYKTADSGDFTVVTLNARSVRNKTTSINDFITTRKPHCIALTETWLGTATDKSIINDVTPDGYNFVSVPRPHGRSGGVGIILDNDASHKITSSTSDGRFKQFEIGQCGKRTVLLCVVYRPQPSKKKGLSVPQFMEEFDVFLEQANTIAHDLILVGDLNFHLGNVNDA